MYSPESFQNKIIFMESIPSYMIYILVNRSNNKILLRWLLKWGNLKLIEAGLSRSSIYYFPKVHYWEIRKKAKGRLPKDILEENNLTRSYLRNTDTKERPLKEVEIFLCEEINIYIYCY